MEALYTSKQHMLNVEHAVGIVHTHMYLWLAYYSWAMVHIYEIGTFVLYKYVKLHKS